MMWRIPLDAKLYAARRAAGLCTKCGKPALPKNAYCEPHRDRQREIDAKRSESRRGYKRRYDRERVDRLTAAGRCTICTHPNSAPHINSRVCPNCNIAVKASKRNWKRSQLLDSLAAEEMELQHRLAKLRERRQKL